MGRLFKANAGHSLGAKGFFGPPPKTTPAVSADLVIVAGAGGFGGGGNVIGAAVWNNGTTGAAGVGSITSGGAPFLGAGVGIDGIGDCPLNTPFGAGALFCFGYFGADPQNKFTSVHIVELNVTYLTASASDFTNGCGCGPSTLWGWTPLAGMINGNTYSFKFT